MDKRRLDMWIYAIGFLAFVAHAACTAWLFAAFVRERGHRRALSGYAYGLNSRVDILSKAVEHVREEFSGPLSSRKPIQIPPPRSSGPRARVTMGAPQEEETIVMVSKRAAK